MEIERRLSHRLVEFWQHIKGDRLLPEERDIRRSLIDDLWDNCFTLHLRDNVPLEGSAFYSYSYVGRSLEPLFRANEEENVNSQLVCMPSAKLVTFCHEIDMTQLPIVENNESFPGENGRIVKYRLCLLPFGTPQGKLQMIFGGMRWKEF